MADGQALRVLLSHVHCWPEHQRGAERYLHELARQLVLSGHRVTLLSSASQPRDELVDGVRVCVLKRRRQWRRRKDPLAYEHGFGRLALKFASRRKFDVWHATSTSDAAASVGLATIRGDLATVFTDHGFPSRASRSKRSDHRAFEKVVAQIGTYISVSEPAAELLRKDYGRSATVISPGVDTHIFACGTHRTARPTIMYSGSLDESRKNLSLLLEAASLLMTSTPDLDLWLIGTAFGDPLPPDLDPSLRARISELGPLPNEVLVQRYQQAWVTVLPADAEVFGMALIESLSCGTPVVGLDDGLGPATIITPDTGVLARRSAAGIAEAIAQAMVLTHHRSTRDACRRRALDFDWELAVVPALEDVYRGLARGGAHAHRH